MLRLSLSLLPAAFFNAFYHKLNFIILAASWEEEEGEEWAINIPS